MLSLPDGRGAQIWQGGAAQGPAVFFVHGCPDSRQAARTGDAAARRTGVRLIAVNRPGYGRSDRCESNHLSVADDLIAVADLLGIDRFALLGMSLGGPYALACAAQYPRRVTAVAALASPAVAAKLDPPWHRDDLSPTQREMFTRIGHGSVAAAVELIRPDFETFVAGMRPADEDDQALAARWIEGLHPLDAALMTTLPVAELAAQAREALATPDGYLRDVAITFRAWEFRPEQVRCPTSLLYGDLDDNAPARNGRWLVERIPGASLSVRSQTAHLGVLLNNWDEVLSGLARLV